MGTRGHARSDAKPTRQESQSHAPTQANRRAPIRNLQRLDGRDAFPDKDIGARQHRKEPACTRLQLQESHENRRDEHSDGCDAGLTALFNLDIINLFPLSARQAAIQAPKRLTPPSFLKRFRTASSGTSHWPWLDALPHPAMTGH